MTCVEGACRGAVFAALLAMPAIAAAQDGAGEDAEGWYVAAAASVSLLDDVANTTTGVPVPPGFVSTTASPDAGLGAQVAFGYDFGRFRLEAEAGYSRNRADRYTALVPPTGSIPGSIRDDSLRGMLNAYVDLTDGPVTPYVGAGAGVAQVNVKVVAPPAFTPAAAPVTLIEDRISGFAYQLFGGVDVRVSKRLSLRAQYRWFDAGTLDGLDSGRRPLERSHSGHNIDFGLRFDF